MRPFHSAAVAAGLLSVAVADCSHNNCRRAVLGASFPTRSGLADCNSFLQTTVTPATSTITVTATLSATSVASVTVTVRATETQVSTAEVTTTTSETVYQPQAKRQVTGTPTSVPAYGYTACHSDVASYTSACFCIGATASTIYAPTPLTTVTVSATAVTTSTHTGTATSTSTTFTTLTRTATSVSTIQSPCPQPDSVAACPYISNQSDGGVAVYSNIVSASCKLPPGGYARTLSVTGDPTDPCAAARSCLQSWADDNFLYGLAVYYSRRAENYVCVGYDGVSIDAGQFSQYDGDVVGVYAFKNA